jgi:hypothetical protein
MQFYSPGATVAASQLVRFGGTEAISKIWQYLRVTSGDDQLASILVEELGRRGFTLMPTIETNSAGQRSAGHYDHIVLLSEADTVHGQYLPRAVQSAFEIQTGMIGSDLSDNTLRSSSAIMAVTNRRMTAPDIVPDWIHKYQYLRGLDGQMPGSPRPNTPTSIQSRGSEGTDARAPTGGAESRERAEGQSQFDYLRRLAARIEHLDNELRRKGEKVAAIGIFGSDVYDKLTNLEALRPGFPEAIFFTTDLDALLLPQGKMRYTRNLVVASGFDLRLRDEPQADIPPFRDTYQTAGFLATRLAIENATVAPDKLSPRLFEIGRTGARPLPINEIGSGLPNDNCSTLAHCSYLHPTIAKLYPPLSHAGRAGIAFIGTAALLALLLSLPLGREFCFAARRWREVSTAGRMPSSERPPHVGWRWITVSLLASVPPIAIASFWTPIGDWLTSNGLGEPVTFLEGTSLWTPTVLRVVSVLTAAYLIVLTFRLIQQNLRETNRALGALDALEKADAIRIGAHPLKWLRAAWTLQPVLVPPGDPYNPDGRPRRRMDELIQQFHISGRTGARALRAGVAALLMMVLWWMLCLVLGYPYSPARGSLVSFAYSLITIVDVVATLFLTFVVIDATLYSRAFILVLTAIRSEWPGRTVQLFMDNLNLPESYLDDWIDMEFMARRTEQIMKLCYFPFIVLALLLLSRNFLFANLPQKLPNIVSAALSTLFIVGSVYALRRSAETARETARQNVMTKLIAKKGNNEKRAAQLEVLLARIDTLQVGAFAPWSSQPLVKAFILPILTYGGAMLLQVYALPGG